MAGKTPRAELAIANLRRSCDEELYGQYELEIIDVLSSRNSRRTRRSWRRRR